MAVLTHQSSSQDSKCCKWSQGPCLWSNQFKGNKSASSVCMVTFLGFFLVVPCSLVTVFLSVQLALTNIDHKTITANFEPLWVCIVVDTFTQVIYHNEQPRVTQYPHVAQLSCRRACSVFCKNRFSVCLLWTSHVWWCKMTRCHKSYKNGIFSIYESLVDMTRYEQDILFSLTSVWLKHYGTEKLAAETKSRVVTRSWTSSTLKLK